MYWIPGLGLGPLEMDSVAPRQSSTVLGLGGAEDVDADPPHDATMNASTERKQVSLMLRGIVGAPLFLESFLPGTNLPVRTRTAGGPDVDHQPLGADPALVNRRPRHLCSCPSAPGGRASRPYRPAGRVLRSQPPGRCCQP